ncbi:MAG: ribosome recycling factor [Parcubacteria group bacterium]
MAHNLTQFKCACETTLAWLKNEYTGLRTGRATPAILDVVSVEAYGSKMGIRELATVSVEDARTIRVTPWDKTVVKAIDSAVRESNLGLSVSVDGEGLRVSFPELTHDRRTTLIKVAKEKLEEARIRVRSERQKVLNEIDAGEQGDDDKVRARNDLQKLVEEANNKLDALQNQKVKEIFE